MPTLQDPNLGTQILFLFLLAIPVACISWTITHEEIFREPREYCAGKSRDCRSLLQRKFFYVVTCEFCLSHYVAAFWLYLSRYHFLFDGWRGYLAALFSLVWIANLYTAIFGRLRLQIQSQRLEIEEEKQELDGPGNADSRPGS